MVTGERHLGSADQVQVVTFEAVDFVIVLDVEAGAVHDFGAYQGGGVVIMVKPCSVARSSAIHMSALFEACYLAP